MNKLLRYWVCISAVLASLLLAGCTKSLDSEIKSFETSRLFSPTDIDARVINKTSVRLSWNKVNKADTYSIQLFDNGNLDFSGTPSKTITDITFDQVPYVVTDLDGETDYSVRVRAIGTNISESKWVSATFKTEPEQIFYSVDPADLGATQVTLRWPAGSNVTQITVNPGSITHTITTDEKNSGVATITGLTGETDYTANLFNGAKIRGTVSFTTLLDLGGAIAVYPTDDLTAILTNASDNDVFALFPGTYNTQDILISKTISVKGAKPTDKPILKGTIFRITNLAGFELKDVVMDGTGSLNGNQAIIYETDQLTAYAPLSVENSIIHDYTKGLLYVNKKALIESVKLKGNIIYNIECSGGDFIDFRAGLAKVFEFTNNTVYHSAGARDLFRMDAGGTTNFPGNTSVITIKNNTFNDNLTTSTSNRYLYIRLATCQITFSKNIVANTLGNYSNQAITAPNLTEMNQNNYFNAPTLISAPGTVGPGTNYTSLDPGFSNAAAGNFTLSNQTLIFDQIGDPRWY